MENNVGGIDSLIHNVKNFNYKAVISSIKEYNCSWIELGVFFASGVVFGFFVKKYFETVILCILFSCAILGVLYYFDFININWIEIKSSMGVDTIPNFGQVALDMFEYLKLHVLHVVFVVIGFIIGYKVG